MEEKLNQHNKKRIQILIGILVATIALLSGLFAYLTIQMKSQKEVTKPTIALVNEDESSSFNKKDYNFGKDFVNLVSGDSKYNWQVVSRSVADRAYADKSVDAVLYIPQSFSHDILTLQDINPAQAQIDYKLQAHQSALSQNLLNDKITSILHGFNQNIVKMYYASVAGNILEAQNNMNDVIANQGNVLTQLSKNVYGPFQSTNQNYSSVISSASSLKSQNSSWIAAQNSFTKSTQSMLEATSKTFNNQLAPLQKYFDTQKQIADVNLKNGNQGIINQSEDDQSFYFKQFDESHTNILNNLFNFYKNDNSNESGVLTNLQNQVHDYNKVITGVHDDLNTQLDSLNSNRDNLLDLENQLYIQFFGQENPEIDLSNFDDSKLEGDYQTKDNAKHALAQKLNTSFGQVDNFSATDYMTKLKGLLSQVSWTSSDYDALFSAMEHSGVDTTQYRHDLDLISRYGNVLPDATPGQVAFNEAPTVNNTDQTFTQTLTIKVPAGQIYKLSPTQVTNAQISYDSAKSSVNISDAKIVDNGNNDLQLYNKDHPVDNQDGTSSIVSNTKDVIFTITYNVSLGQNIQATTKFGWGINTNENSSSANYTLYPGDEVAEYLGGNKFGAIAQLLSNIDKTANFITWIYGKPSDSVEDVLNKLPEAASLENFTSLAPNNDSIFDLYGNMDLAQLEARLSDKDIGGYQSLGHDNIEKVIQAIRALNTNIEVLMEDRDILSDNLPDDVFNQKIKDLQNWYSTTLSAVNQQYESWEKNTHQTLALKSWQAYNSNDISLYQDKSASDDLYKTISELSTSTAKSAESTSKSAQLIKDNANEFNQMVMTTQETKASAEKLLRNTDTLLNTGNVSLKDSKNYNDNFGKILANTQSQNADKNQLYNFFAQPLSIKNLTGAITSIKKGFDWRWLLMLVMGILLGILGTLSSKIFINRKRKS